MTAKLRTLLQNLSLRKKFLLIFCSLLFLSTAVILLMSGYVFHQYEAELYQSTAQQLRICVNTIEGDLAAIEQVGMWAVTNTAVQSMLNDQQLDLARREPVLLYSRYARDLYETLSDSFHQDPHISSAYLFAGSSGFSFGSQTENYAEETLDLLWEAAAGGRGRAVWLAAPEKDGSLIYVREIRDIQHMTFRTVGLLAVRVDLQTIVFERVNERFEYSDPTEIAIYAGDGTILFNNLSDGRQEPLPLPGEDGYIRETLNGREYFVTSAIRSDFGFRYALYLPIDAINASSRLMRTTVVVLTVVLFLLCAWSCSRLISQITEHFERLVAKMRLFQEGKLPAESDGYSGRQDELGYLHRSFDQMVRDFNRLVEENYVKQIAVKDARLRALQAQLNPHFLFNILQTLHWRAKAAGQEEISEIVDALGKMLRYSLREQDMLVPLRRELEFTSYYTKLQKYRYKDRLDISVDVPEEFLALSIPPMAVQTLVENAVKYALETMEEPCRIRVRAERRGTLTALTVEDNGPGIDEAILSADAQESGASGMGIGLKNLKQRLTLLLGEQANLRVINTGGGTQVELLLPPGPPEKEKEA